MKRIFGVAWLTSEMGSVLCLLAFSFALSAYPRFTVAASCNLTFTSPASGTTVTTPTVNVSGTGSGTADPGAYGTVTATVNGQVFFQRSGVFTRLIDFFGSGSAVAPLVLGQNQIRVSGSVDSCSASDQISVFYEPELDDPPKERGEPAAGGCEGNPCNVATGNKYQREVDYQDASGALQLVRHYNSDARDIDLGFGRGWSSAIFRRLSISADALLLRQDSGRGEVLRKEEGSWVAAPDSEIAVSASGDTLIVVTPDNRREHYSDQGLLLSEENEGRTTRYQYNHQTQLVGVVAPSGRSLQFEYDDAGRVAQVIAPGGSKYQYRYDEEGHLLEVIYPDDTPSDDTDNPRKLYHYEGEGLPGALTGITNENDARFASWSYDAEGRVTSSEHAAGVGRVSLSYNADGTTTVTGTLGEVRTYSFEEMHGVRRVTEVAGERCLDCPAIKTRRYDENGFLSAAVDYRGHETTYIRNEYGVETARTEAVGTTQERTITTDWHTEFRVPLKIIEPGRETTFTYNDAGQLLTRTETHAAVIVVEDETEEDAAAENTEGDTPEEGVAATVRTVTRSYYTADDFAEGDQDVRVGLLKSVDGPRTDVVDVTHFEYNEQGNLTKMTNTLGQVTQITSHDVNGRPLTVIDPNRVSSMLAYDARGRLLSRTVDSQETAFTYDGAGNVTAVKLADGSVLKYAYDAAGRLISVEDSIGNRITYTLDGLGNRTGEEIHNPEGILTRSIARSYNNLGRLLSLTGGADQLTSFTYDAQGNQLTQTVDPDGLQQRTTHTFDSLNRLSQVVDAAAGVTAYSYDARDNLLGVTDAAGLLTSYTYDGLDNVLSQMSPDSGASTYSYDAAGNQLSKTDAAGVTTTFSYDALNRLLAVRYPGGEQDVVYRYDEAEGCTGGIGRLCQMRDASGVSTFSYDAFGNVLSKTVRTDGLSRTIAYEYDAAGRLLRMTYPSGRAVNYQRDAAGRVIAVSSTLAGEDEVLLNDMTYLPFGPLSSYTYGNGLAHIREYDEDYRLTSLSTGLM